MMPRQLALCLLGTLVQFGWEKAFSGYDDELAWWESPRSKPSTCWHERLRRRGPKAWADGPASVYGRLAATMLEHAPAPVAGADVLDVGAGTAVACDAALANGARRAVATDLAEQMLRRRSSSYPPWWPTPSACRSATTPLT